MKIGMKDERQDKGGGDMNCNTKCFSKSVRLSWSDTEKKEGEERVPEECAED